RAIDFLEELRFRLPLSVQIWAGGGAMRNSRRQVESVQIFNDLSSMRQAVLQWRRSKGIRVAY
ncbi:MAG: hypothetical protein KDI39_13335, partial [Pseudomonadales bacterium]|nr:hypothetical protein [Pseudomonadales bacterium]